MDELIKYRKSALVNGLCSEYRGYWQAAGTDKRKLITLALSQQALPHLMTYCWNGEGLSKKYILDNFNDYINGKQIIYDADGVKGCYTYQLYVDFNDTINEQADVNAFMWCDNPIVEMPTSRCVTFYVGCNTTLHLSMQGFNNARIYLFDTSEVVFEEADKTCSATVYEYSDQCVTQIGQYCLSNKIKVHRKQLRL
jgi:hypothetical protein